MDVVTLALAKKSAKSYTDTVIDNLPKGVIYKGSVNYYADLPSAAALGDCYTVAYKGTTGTEPYGAEYIWGLNTATNIREWIKVGEEIDLSGKEDKTNKVTELNENSTNTQYPSAKAVYDELVALEEENEALRNDLNNSTLTISGTGENVTLANTAEARFKKLEVQGNSKQETTSTEQGDEYDSPSPEHPSEVQTITGNANVVICNKNFINIENTSTTINGVTITVNNDGTILFNGTATSRVAYAIQNNFKKIKAGQYFLSGCPQNGSSSTYGMVLWNKDWVSLGWDYGNGKLITLLTDVEAKVHINISSGTVCNNLLFKPQLEEGSTATTYIPHKHQNYVLPLGNMELCKIRDYKDYIYKENNKWYKHKTIAKDIFDGSADEAWLQEETTNAGKRYRIGRYTISGASAINIFCDKLIGITASQTWSGNEGVSAATNIQVYLTEYSQNKTLAEFKAWLVENPLTVYYILRTPTDEEITDTSLISILNQIEKTAHSYSDITHIYSTDELNPIFDVRAVGDLNAILANQNQENS